MIALNTSLESNGVNATITFTPSEPPVIHLIKQVPYWGIYRWWAPIPFKRMGLVKRSVTKSHNLPIWLYVDDATNVCAHVEQLSNKLLASAMLAYANVDATFVKDDYQHSPNVVYIDANEQSVFDEFSQSVEDLFTEMESDVVEVEVELDSMSNQHSRFEDDTIPDPSSFELSGEESSDSDIGTID